MRTLILSILLCLTWGHVMAQNISGRVIDNEGSPIVGVNCILLEQNDSTYVTGGITGLDGKFALEAGKDKEYLLQFSFIGYKTMTLPCRPGNIGDISLEMDAALLEEVVVSADSKNAVTQTFFLTDSLRNSSPNSLQLLDRLDGVSVDWMSDAVKIGEYRDVPVMVNGREVGKELVNNLNPQRIKKIELLRFPKGKYGEMPIVLNFITYDSYLGYDLGVQSKGIVSFREPNSHNESVGANFIYTLDKWNIYSEAEFSNKKTYSATSYSYIYKGENAETTAQEDYRRPNEENSVRSLRLSLGADYKIAPGHTLSLQSWLDGGRYFDFEKYLNTDDSPLSENTNSYDNINSTSGLFYRGAITDNFTITSDLTYNYYHVSESRGYKSQEGLSMVDYTGSKDYWRYNLNADNTWNKILSSNIGYTYTYKSYINKDRKTSETMFSSFEGRHDLYAYLMVNPHPKISLAAGSNVLFVERDNGTDSDSRCSWMPSAKLYWRPLDKLSVSGNYFCDVEYPNLDQLSTVTYSRNQVLKYRGNPDLRERVMHYMEWRINIPKVIELTYMLKHSANDITPWYFLENDYVVETLTGSRYLHQYVGVTGDYNIGKKLHLNLTANYQWYGRKGAEDVWHRGRTWYLDLTGSYMMNKYVSFMASYFLRHDRLPLLQGKEYGQEEMLTVGAMGKLCKGRLGLSVNFVIPTCLIPKHTYRDINITDFRFTSREDNRVNNAMVMVGLRFNLGKGEASKADNRNLSENEKY